MSGTEHHVEGSVSERRRRYVEPGLELFVSADDDPLGGHRAEVVATDDRAVWIGVPLRRDGLLELTPGELVSVRFHRQGDAAYLFDTVVREVRPVDPAPYGLAWPVRIDRRHQRSHVRVALVLRATYRPVDEGGGAPDEPGGEWVPGAVVDLSAGGLALIGHDRLEAAAVVAVRATLPHPAGAVQLDAPAVVRSVAPYGRTPAGRELWRHGLELGGVDPAIREAVVAATVGYLTGDGDGVGDRPPA